MPPPNLQHHCNVHLLCCHNNTKIVAPTDCATESITDGLRPRYCQQSWHLPPLLHCTMQCTSITMSCTCQHTHTRSVQQLTTSYFNTHCNIRARPSVLLLTQATHALPLSSKHTAIIHQMPDNIHQQGQGLCNLHLSAHTRKMTFCTNGTMAFNHRSAPHNQATRLSHPSNM